MCTQIYVLSKNDKISHFLRLNITIFTAFKYRCILNWCVFVMFSAYLHCRIAQNMPLFRDIVSESELIVRKFPCPVHRTGKKKQLI